MPVIRIAITGGPCGGKTTLLARAKEFLDGRSYKTIVVPEAATELIVAGFPPRPELWRDPVAFQEHLLKLTLSREAAFEEAARDLVAAAPVVLLCDRGAPEVAAYAGPDEYTGLLKKLGRRPLELLLRYRQAIHMVTAADGAEQYYTLANNAARSETPARARELDKLTQAAWHGHPHLTIIRNEGSFEMKVRQALSALSRTLGFRDILWPLERERMFLIRNFRHEFIPDNAVRRDIWQTYLGEQIAGQERRVRKVLCKHDITYYYTVKVGSKTMGERDEADEIIEPRRYNDLLGNRDSAYQEVIKTRHSFTYANRYFELDDFRHPVSNLYTVEIENAGPDEVIEFPPGWDVLEVTGDKRFSNRAIAGGSLKDFESAA
jgi:CYTH domain-containing protein/predicted ATPase